MALPSVAHALGGGSRAAVSARPAQQGHAGDGKQRPLRSRCSPRLMPGMDASINCRTEALGGQLLQCDHCGQEHDVYHSCRNRSCPKCHRLETEAWLAERRQELLPVPYFHVVFTVPQELRALIRRHQQDLYHILLRAAAHSLIKLAADPHDVGGLIGVLCVLHTWTPTLASHPHVHCLVPAGGVSADRTEWRPARQTYLVPVQALSQLLRGLLRALVRQERPDLTIPASVWTKGWVVYCKPALQGTEQVLNDLGRYVHRIALTNSRLLSIEDGQVRFRSQDASDQRWKTMTLPAHACIRRFLQHVLPQGSTKSATMGCGAPSIAPSCTNSNSGWRDMPPSHLQPRPHGRSLRPTPGVHPCERGNPVHPAVKACWS